MVLIKLKIRFIDGTDTIISIDDQATIATLHQSIAASTSVPIAEQRLIFKGKVLSDDQCKIRDCGLSNDIVIHLVRRTVPQIPSPRVNNVVNEEARGAADQSGFTEHISRTISHIIGQVPFERNGIFADPSQTMSIIGNIIQQLESRFRIDTQCTLHLNQPQHNDFSINVRLRGVRQQFINSPARERFETLCIELRKLAWLVVLIKAQFLGEVDAILSAQGQQTTEDQKCRAMARVLRAMNAYDHFDEVEMNNYVLSNYVVVGARDIELTSIIEQLEHWQLDEDEAHIQQLNPVMSVRHCTSHDLSTFLMMFSVVQAKISEYLMDRYYRVLQSPHIHQVSSHPARMLNCFSNAMARVQHYCAHIYHALSDLGLHADQNPHNRLYPQLVIHQRHENEEPGLSQAEINFVFSDPSNDQNGRQSPIRDGHPPRANGQIPGQNQQPPPSARIFPGPPANRNFGQGRQFRFPSPQLNERQIEEDLRLFQRQPSTQNGNQRVHFNPNQRPMDHRQPSPPNQPHPSQNNDQPPQPSQQGAASAGNPVNSILSGLLNIAQFVGIGGGVASHLQQQPAPPPARQAQQQQRPVAMRMVEAVSVPRSTGIVQPAAATIQQTQRQQQNSPPPSRQLPPRQRQSIQFEYQRQRQPMEATIPYHQFMAQPLATGGTTNSTATAGRSSQTPPPFPTQPPPPTLAQQQYRSISAERVMGRGGQRRMQMPPFGAALGFQQQNVNWGRTGSNETGAMFIGPNEPTEFPMFTMDRFLACPSRRYRLFEMDSRHFNFWNDPRTIARGIEPPPNSIAGLERAGGPPPGQAPEAAEAFESLFNLEPRPQANANGDAIFNEIGQFAQYAQRLLSPIAWPAKMSDCYCPARYHCNADSLRIQELPATLHSSQFRCHFLCQIQLQLVRRHPHQHQQDQDHHSTGLDAEVLVAEDMAGAATAAEEVMTRWIWADAKKTKKRRIFKKKSGLFSKSFIFFSV